MGNVDITIRVSAHEKTVICQALLAYAAKIREVEEPPFETADEVEALWQKVVSGGAR
jgi:hypothetical protein